MPAKTNKVIVTLCGPSDVAKEIGFAKEILNKWNEANSAGLNTYVEHRHWQTDAVPQMGVRSQEVINHQIIDDADIIVAVFWHRFGSPTGVADSGTEEEIKRGIARKKRVMVYFSELEPLPPSARADQITKLASFRTYLEPQGLYATFSSRKQFQDAFERHIAKTLNDLLPKAKPIKRRSSTIKQTITGNNNIQAGGNVTYHEAGSVVKEVVERRPGSISAAEQHQLHVWIEELAEGTYGIPLEEAFRKWWSRLKRKVKVSKIDDIMSSQMDEIKTWHTTQKAIQINKSKAKDPDFWKSQKIKSIKTWMNTMGVSKDDYYEEITKRLKLKKPLRSLTQLTKRDLGRVYTLVQRDKNEK